MSDTEPPAIRIVSANATPDEIAAVTALVTAALNELALQQNAESPTVSAWQHSQRALRRASPSGTAWRSL